MPFLYHNIKRYKANNSMTIKDAVIDVARLSKDFDSFYQNLRTRLGWHINLIQPELISSLWAKELQKRGLGFYK